MDLLEDLVLVEGREERGAENGDAEERDVLNEFQNAADPVSDGGDEWFRQESLGFVRKTTSQTGLLTPNPWSGFLKWWRRW